MLIIFQRSHLVTDGLTHRTTMHKLFEQVRVISMMAYWKNKILAK